jgi:hypothetical protein
MVGIKRGDNPSIPSNPIKGILLDRVYGYREYGDVVAKWRYGGLKGVISD